jgi:ubiquinone/menaquinone biosynthesis C-methylase UbiE
MTQTKNLLFIFCLGLTACPTPLLAQQESVKPGINSTFESPNVEQFVGRFERDGREPYDQRKSILEACQLRPGMVVADVGAGTGLFTRLFAEQVGSEGQVFAVDISDEFVEHVRRSCQEAGISNVSPVICDPNNVRLPPASVELVFICDTYHHFEFPQKTMQSVHRALRPGGTLILIDFRRIEGTSSDWVLNHVRAGEDEVTKEIKECGFEWIESVDLLNENYFVRFRRP